MSARGDRLLATRAWDGTEPGVLLVHGTGFNKELWDPVIAALIAREGPVAGVAVDQRGHGASSAMAIPMDWSQIGDDVAQVVASSDPRPRIGVGHSSGGAAIAMAAIADREAFDHLVLIEPIIQSPPNHRHEDDPMAAAAERRRSSFPDRSAARGYLAGKSPYEHWVEAAMDAYVGHGLRDDDGEVVLACAPATEAEHYRAGWAHSTWDHLPHIHQPVTLIVGSESTTHHGRYLSELTARFSDVELQVVPGASHLVPMERPEVIAAAIRNARNSG